MTAPLQLLCTLNPAPELSTSAYGPFVVHVFTPKSREFYDLERLWGGAKREEVKD